MPYFPHRYGPTAGIKELRHAVANLYNETYRQGKDSQYTHENVCIVPGGRAGLIRIAAIIGVSEVLETITMCGWWLISIVMSVGCLRCLPDSGCGCLDIPFFSRTDLRFVLQSIPPILPCSPLSGVFCRCQHRFLREIITSFTFPNCRKLSRRPTFVIICPGWPFADFLLDQRSTRYYRSMGISVVVMSNPRNPTGQVIKGKELEELVDISRRGVTLVCVDSIYPEVISAAYMLIFWSLAWMNSILGISTLQSWKARASLQLHMSTVGSPMHSMIVSREGGGGLIAALIRDRCKRRVRKLHMLS